MQVKAFPWFLGVCVLESPMVLGIVLEQAKFPNLAVEEGFRDHHGGASLAQLALIYSTET